MPIVPVHAAAAGGPVSASLVLPDGEHARLPLVCFFPDAGGPRGTMTSMAERLASHGYAVLIVDPYAHLPPYEPFDVKTVFTDPPERARLFAMIQAFDTKQIVADAAALADAITDVRVTKERFGTMGYCMGGRIAFIAATILGERVAAVAAIHAGGLVNDKPESPHRQLASVRARIYVGAADQDASCSLEHQAALDQALTEANLEHQIELYEGAKHGFAVPDFPVYDEPAAEKHWQRVLALFEATLR
ncbi:MAG: dienelactone hydrolase family protein [Deltaproteobacteria bacterium]|nr:dienelactone hydrolase family protein [Deltaproteobacteria bacterium]